MSGRRLFMVRHGETEGESSIRFHGINDVPLSDVGRAQVRALIPRLERERFSAAVHSPLIRAVESARILLAALHEPPPLVEPDEGLREINFGRFEGMTVEEIEATDPQWFVDWRADRVDHYPGGDTYDGFRGRVGDALLDLPRRYRAGDVLLVAHKGVLKNALHVFCGLDRDDIRSWDMDLGSLWVLREGDPWTVECRNWIGASA